MLVNGLSFFAVLFWRLTFLAPANSTANASRLAAVGLFVGEDLAPGAVAVLLGAGVCFLFGLSEYFGVWVGVLEREEKWPR